MRWLSLLLLLLLSCVEDLSGRGGPFHEPTTVMSTDRIEMVRGHRTVRGIIHAHSPYSHDACDDEPFVDGVRNEACFNELREGMCLTAQDFVFLTDHNDYFANYDYPDVLLYAPGDELIERDGAPAANRVVCPDGRRVIVSAGTESAMMPIGLEHHVGATPEERHDAYNAQGDAAIAALREAGALVFLQHTEGWPIEDVLSVDGIEIYNLHQNLKENAGEAAIAVLQLAAEPDQMPIPELALMTFFQENERDLSLWSQAVQQRQISVALASDVHRNAFSDPTYDGERLDSFRRVMHWFSNYLRVPEEVAVDDRVLKAAIADGRLYGAFDYLGYPLGFDWYAEPDVEMGSAVTGPATLHLVAPEVYRLDPTYPPDIRTLILRAAHDGWEVAAQGDGDLDLHVLAGVYRAEVRMIPHHLEAWLGDNPQNFLKELVWIYSSPIYVGQ